MIKPMLIASAVTGLAGGILFLFIFWEKLKEDFSSDLIFKMAFNILLPLSILNFVALRFFPPFFLWLSFFGGLIGIFISVFKFKVNAFEIFEVYVVSGIPWLSLVFLTDSVTRSSLYSFLAFLVSLILIFISYWLDVHYKSFSWYKSGKIGFTGIATLILIFCIRLVLDIFRIGMISFVGQLDGILSGLGLLVCIGFLAKLTVKKI
jgi:hypothetical protein